jgi:iron(III) transport system substrate-binding protein
MALLTGCAGRAGAGPGLAPGRENRLSVYTSHKEEVYAPIIKEFEERTGIWVQLVTGGTTDLLERISGESGSPSADVLFGGGVESLSAYREFFEPYRCAHYADIKTEFRSEEDLWTAFSALPVVIIYNTKLVPQGGVTGWGDLLNPAWKGRIALADPLVSASSYTGVMTMLQSLSDSPWETLDTFAANLGGSILSDSGDVVPAVLSGSKSLGITLEETAARYVSQGADIAIVYPGEGTSAVPDGCALLKGARNPETAKLFIDFVLSKEAQEHVVTAMYRRSVREDVEDPSDLISWDGIILSSYDLDWAAGEKPAFAGRWLEALAP